MRIWLYLSMVSVLGLGLLGLVGAARVKENPIDKITPAQNLNLNQMSGKWYLISVASRCQYLLKNNLKVESTIMTLTAPTSSSSPMSVSTLRKLNYQCWEIKQEYESSKTLGRFLLKGRIQQKNVDIVIAETDYSSYAIFYYQRQGKISLKLYGRSTVLTDAVVDKFEELAGKQNLGLDLVFQFPDYGFCETADKDHVLVM